MLPFMSHYHRLAEMHSVIRLRCFIESSSCRDPGYCHEEPWYC